MQRVYRRFIFSFQFPNFINAFQRLQLYSTSSDSDSFVNYLVHSLGLSHQQARSASTKIFKYKKVNNFQYASNAHSVVGFFKNHGFDDTLLRKLVSSNPRLLNCKVEKTLEPKFKFFQDQGFSGSDIIQIISRNPTVFGMGLESVLVPAIQTFRQLLGSDTHVVAALKNLRAWSFMGVADNLLRNVALLDSCGIPMELIKKHLIRKPVNFIRKPESFKDAVTRVEQKLGIRNDSPLFMYGVVLCCSFSEENSEAKFRMFKSFGWTQSDIEKFIMRNTSCFTLSEASFKKKLEFLIKEVKLEPAFLITHTSLLTCSLEKRVVPRYKVLVILKEKGLMKKYPSLNSIVAMSETCFLTRFVLPFKEVYEVYAKHTGCSLKPLMSDTRESR